MRRERPLDPARLPDADVLVVGGGVAGWSAAYFASRAGRRVVLVDEGLHRASDLPIALINPLRGRTGRLVAHGVAGMHASFALIDALRAAGHRIEAGRGLYRPLVGVAPDAAQRAFWTARIGPYLAFDWHDVAPASLGLAAPVAALRLHDAGWVVPRSLLAALRIESRAVVVVDRVVGVDGDDRGGGRVSLAEGRALDARSLLWCGGAWGAELLDRSGSGDDASAPATVDDGLYKPGSLVVVDAALTREPMSFGLYAVPYCDGVPGPQRAGTLVGPTREGSQVRFPDAPVSAEVVAHLGDRIARDFGCTMPVRPIWRGVRLTRLSSAASTALAGAPTLTALDSRGFLTAPLLAAAWARSL